MFSSRTPGSFAPNRLTERFDACRNAGRKVLDLTESNPTRAGFQYPADVILDALRAPESLRYQADPRGLPRAREAVSAYYAGREGLRVPPDRILLTASTSEAYSFLLKLLAEPGDAVLVPRPSYPLFDHLLRLEGVRPAPYPLRYDGTWHIGIGELERLVTPDCRAIVVVNPNNPTGAFLKTHEHASLTTLCRRHGLALISDEVFSDYGWSPASDRIETVAVSSDVLSFSMSGLSKVLGLPQMKLGWILVNGPEPLLGEALERLEFIADTYLSVGTPVQQALPTLLSCRLEMQARIRSRLEENRERLRAGATRVPGVTLLPSEGGWYQVLRVPRVQSEEALVIELLEQDDVLVHPGFFFDFEQEAFMVVSLLTAPDVFSEGIARLFQRVDRWMRDVT